MQQNAFLHVFLMNLLMLLEPQTQYLLAGLFIVGFGLFNGFVSTDPVAFNRDSKSQLVTFL